MEMEKHVARHMDDEPSKCSNVTQSVDPPSAYKYECTRHRTCKKFFKTVPSLKAHLTKYKDRDFPQDKKAVVDADNVEGVEGEPPRPKGAKATKKKTPSEPKTRKGKTAAVVRSEVQPPPPTAHISIQPPVSAPLHPHQIYASQAGEAKTSESTSDVDRMWVSVAGTSSHLDQPDQQANTIFYNQQ